jgi:hypothetical protein
MNENNNQINNQNQEVSLGKKEETQNTSLNHGNVRPRKQHKQNSTRTINNKNNYLYEIMISDYDNE